MNIGKGLNPSFTIVYVMTSKIINYGIIGLIIFSLTSIFLFYLSDKENLDLEKDTSIYKDPYNNDEKDDEVLNTDDSDDEKNGNTNNNENSVCSEEKLSNVSINFSGYCYNPDYPESGPSKEEVIFNLEEITNDKIYSTEELYFKFEFEDDHFEWGSDTNTGDIFTMTLYCSNRSGGYLYVLDNFCTFPGGGGTELTMYCGIEGEGIYYDTTWYLIIEISNCGEYSKYWRWEVFTEPDPGNDWNVFINIKYIST